MPYQIPTQSKNGKVPTITDSASTLVDSDHIVSSVGGNLVRLSASRFWNYINNKIVGAISPLLTSNLTANRIVVSDASGKIAANQNVFANRALASDASGLPIATGVTDTELAVLSANATPDTTTVPADTDNVVSEVGGTMKQLRLVRLWDYIKSKILGDNFIRVYRANYYLNNRSGLYSYPNQVVNGFGFTLEFNNGWILKVSHNTSPSSISVMRNGAQSGNNYSSTYLTVGNGGQICSFTSATGDVSYIAEGMVCLYTDTTVHLNYRLICYNPSGSTTGAMLMYW